MNVDQQKIVRERLYANAIDIAEKYPSESEYDHAIDRKVAIHKVLQGRSVAISKDYYDFVWTNIYLICNSVQMETAVGVMLNPYTSKDVLAYKKNHF